MLYYLSWDERRLYLLEMDCEQAGRQAGRHVFTEPKPPTRRNDRSAAMLLLARWRITKKNISTKTPTFIRQNLVDRQLITPRMKIIKIDKRWHPVTLSCLSLIFEARILYSNFCKHVFDGEFGNASLQHAFPRVVSTLVRLQMKPRPRAKQSNICQLKYSRYFSIYPGCVGIFSGIQVHEKDKSWRWLCWLLLLLLPMQKRDERGW